MRLICSLSIAALTALSPVAAATAAERQFEPASQWQVDNEPQICRLNREYSDGTDKISIRMEQFQPGAGVHILLVGKPFDRAEFGRRYEVRLGRSGTPFRAFNARIALPDGRDATLLPSVQFIKPSQISSRTWPDDAQFEAIDQLSFSAPVMGTVTLQTRTLVKAMAEMRKCHERMVAGWGHAAAQPGALSRGPTPSTEIRTWAMPRDYPLQPGRRGRSSIVVFRLDVDASGHPRSCKVPRAYTAETFAETTCKLMMERARFAPARDERGNPVPSYFVSSVVWLI